MDPGLRGDFVACIQAIGFNSHFKAANTLACVERLVLAANGGGVLVFNMLPHSQSCREDVLRLLRKSFSNVEELAYGAFNFPLGAHLSMALCAVMLRSPALRTLLARRRYLYTCTGRNN
jgi:hypothetical protein